MTEFETLRQMILVGDDGAPAHTEELLRQGIRARDVLEQALLPGMEAVGEGMKCGDIFIPEVLQSARTMQACLDIVRPHLDGAETLALGTVVIGTVEGDLHDIGKNLVAMLLSGAGFDVVNLGRGITPAGFVSAVKEHRPEILGMSALLTTTVAKMPATINALKEAGLRDQVRIIVGGAPVTAAYAQEIGADAYGPTAPMAVEVAKSLLSDAASVLRP